MSMSVKSDVALQDIDSQPEQALDQSARIRELKDLIQASGPDMDDLTLQSVIGTALNIYVERFDAGHRGPIVAPNSRLNATAVLIAATMLMKSENVEGFELGMWQTFSGIK